MGHLRAAIIGESIKRMGRFLGHHMIGDVHLGTEDNCIWALSFESGTGSRSWCDTNFGVNHLRTRRRLYHQRTGGDISCGQRQSSPRQMRCYRGLIRRPKLQRGYSYCWAIWQHIMAVSVADLKKNYANLNVNSICGRAKATRNPTSGT